MNITLKNIQYNIRLSEETNCFSATIYVDGAKAGEARNNGQGGCTTILPRTLEAQIDAYAATLPPQTITGDHEPMILPQTAESIIDNLVAEHMAERHFAQTIKGKFLFTIPGKIGIYAVKEPRAGAEMTISDAEKEKIRLSLKAEKVLNFLPKAEALAVFRTAP